MHLKTTQSRTHDGPGNPCLPAASSWMSGAKPTAGNASNDPDSDPGQYFQTKQTNLSRVVQVCREDILCFCKRNKYTCDES